MGTDQIEWTDGRVHFRGRAHRCEEPRARVLLVHGLGEHSGRYDHVVEFLLSQKFDVARFDMRGHGHSGGPRGDAPTYETLLDDIDRFAREVDDVLPPAPVFLYGHSLGGNLVLNHALRRRSDWTGVVASAPAIRTYEPPPRIKVLVGRMLRPLVPGFRMHNGIDLDALARDGAVIDDYLGDPLTHSRISVRLGLDVLESGEWLLQGGHEAHQPILIIHGDADKLTSHEASRAFAEATRGVEFRSWPGGRHELHNDPDQADVLRFIADWITAQSSP